MLTPFSSIGSIYPVQLRKCHSLLLSICCYAADRYVFEVKKHLSFCFVLL